MGFKLICEKCGAEGEVRKKIIEWEEWTQTTMEIVGDTIIENEVLYGEVTGLKVVCVKCGQAISE